MTEHSDEFLPPTTGFDEYVEYTPGSGPDPITGEEPSPTLPEEPSLGRLAGFTPEVRRYLAEVERKVELICAIQFCGSLSDMDGSGTYLFAVRSIEEAEYVQSMLPDDCKAVVKEAEFFEDSLDIYS